MLAVALISAFIAMRLAIHGREAVVPPVTGLTVTEAASAAGRQGLRVTVENRFYSSEVPLGHVIAQDPAPGFRVRRDWPVRITESLGAQRVSIPNLVGQSERAAMITIRQLGLEPGAVVRMPAPGDPDVVIAQTPTAQAGEVSSPRISLLVSDGEAAETAAYVMPSLVGLSYAAAAARTSAAGLKMVAAEEIIASPGPVATSAGPAGATAAGVPAAAAGAPAVAAPSAQPAPAAAAPPPPTSGTVVAQSPPAGARVQQGDVVHVTVSQETPAQ
jgi:beta-lactam-binding protein with PASTA domain